MEYMSLSMSPYDIDRFGALLPRFSPRQADLLMVIGTVNHKLSPVLKRVYEQMSEPKWVMAFGACAASGGFYDNYATVQGIDRIIPVDVYVPGCPPRPEAVLDGLMELQSRIAQQKQPIDIRSHGEFEVRCFGLRQNGLNAILIGKLLVAQWHGSRRNRSLEINAAR